MARIVGVDLPKNKRGVIMYIFGINDLELLQSEAFKFLEDLKIRGFVLGALD